MKPIYVLGGGSVGAPLASFLGLEKRSVVLVRTRPEISSHAETLVQTDNGTESLQSVVPSVSLDDLDAVDGIIVVTSKTYANQSIAERLKAKYRGGPVILAQNGLNVEKEFIHNGFPTVGRSVLYLTSEPAGNSTSGSFFFRPIGPSLVGTISGDENEIKQAATALNTKHFPFEYAADLQVSIFKKAIINVVYNSICPLLEVDNGVFSRDASLEPLVNTLIDECLQVTEALHVPITRESIQKQIAVISQKSKQLISTLQDLRNGRETEMDSLNFEFLRIAASTNPAIRMPLTQALGELVVAKSRIARGV